MNSFAPVDPSLIDVKLPPSGYGAERESEDSLEGIRDACMGADRDFPPALWIEPKDRDDRKPARGQHDPAHVPRHSKSRPQPQPAAR